MSIPTQKSVVFDCFYLFVAEPINQMTWKLAQMFFSTWSTIYIYDTCHFEAVLRPIWAHIVHSDKKKVSFSMVFSKLWPAQCTKWLENWHSYTLAQGLQDLLMTFCVLRPLAGTFGPKTNFRGQKMADPPIFNRSLWPQIWSNLKNFWGIL